MKQITVSDCGVGSTFDVYEFGTGTPCITFTGGVHGNEVTGVCVAQRLIEFFTKTPPQHGSVKIIPFVNASAMRVMHRCSPIDDTDLNRIFPGDKNGSFSYKLANALWDETENAEYIVDLHCCSQETVPYILSVYTEYPEAKKLAQDIPLMVAIKSEGTAGQLFTESCRQRKQTALIIELPSAPSSGGVNLPAAQQCYDALLSMLAKRGFISGAVESAKPVLCGGLCDFTAPHGGFWMPSVTLGESVSAGQTIGHMDKTPVCSGCDCIVMHMRPCGYAFADNLDVGFYAQPYLL